MHGSRRELDLDLHTVEGALPQGMSGHLFVMAPLPWGDGSPVFNGDAMAMRVDFESQGARFKSRVLKDPSQRLDRITRKNPLLRFRNRHIARVSPVLGVRNELNTAWLTMPAEGRLFATYDAGRPWEVDPVTLEVMAPVGGLKDWEQAFAIDLPWLFPPVLTGAHPAHDDRTGDTYFPNYSLGAVVAGAHVRLLRWNGSGALCASRIVDERGCDLRVQSLHQLAITERWVILADTAFRLELGRFLFPRAWPLTPQRPYTAFHFVDRAQLNAGGTVRAKRVVIPRETIHFTADYDCTEGKVTLHLGHPCASDASETLQATDRQWSDNAPIRPELIGFPASPTDVGMFARYTVDVEAGVVESASLYHDEGTWGPALFTASSVEVRDRHRHLWWTLGGVQRDSLVTRVVDAYRGYPYRKVPVRTIPQHVAPELVRVDAPHAKVVDRFAFPEGVLPSSPQYIPSTTGEREIDGYIVCTAVGAGVRRSSSGDELWVFEAGNLAKGPVCKLGHPALDFAVTLHTTWLPRIRELEESADVNAEVEARVEELPPVWPWTCARRAARHLICRSRKPSCQLAARQADFSPYPTWSPSTR
jgi:carotenoid cleavage dioxygenase-like enzyme